MRLFRALFPVLPNRKRLYLDLDGVLLVMLGREVAPARYAEDFLDFSLANFEVYWLVTHSQGDARPVLDRLGPATPATLRRKLARVRPARFHIEKTEVLAGDCYWLGARPLLMELSHLRQRHQGDRWFEVNTYVRPDDLLRALEYLRSVVACGDPPGASGVGGPRCEEAPAREPGSRMGDGRGSRVSGARGALGMGQAQEPAPSGTEAQP
jgi:hypothetical protein